MVSCTAVRTHENSSGTGLSTPLIATVSRPVRRVRSSSKNAVSPSVADMRRNWVSGMSSSGTCQAHPRSGSV